MEFGVEPIVSWRLNNKNSTDIKMTVDMMYILDKYNHINNYILVSGDSDFREVCSKIKSYGKNVIGISVNFKSTSHILKNYCSEFIILDKDKNADESLKNAIENIQIILTDSPKLNIGELKRRLCNKNSMFNERNFGFNNFSNFIISLSETVKLVKDQSGNFYASNKSAFD